MKIYHILCYAMLLNCLFVANINAAAAVATKKVAIEANEANSKKAIKAEKKALKKQAKQEKRAAKLDKKLGKLKKKMAKMGMDSEEFIDGVVDAPKFRLGLVLILGALALALLQLILPGSNGLLGWVSGMAALVGLILIVWAFLENA